MQGQRSAASSATCDSTVDPQRYWNRMQDPSEEHLSDCVVLSSNANIAYQGSAPHEEYGSSIWNLGESSSSGAHRQVNLNDSCHNSVPHEGIGLSGWGLGESSSSAVHNQVYQNDPVSEGSRAARLFVERRHLSSESPSLDNNNNVNQHAEHSASGRLFMQSSIPQNLINLELSGRDDDDDDDDCQVIECVDAFRYGSSFQGCHGSSSASRPFGTSSGIGGFIVEDTDESPRSLLDSRRPSCKRKALEASIGQSSRSGSSSYAHPTESSSWQGMTFHHNTASSVPVPTENLLNVNLSDQSHPRLGLRVGGPASDVPLALSSTATAENSRRYSRLRINNSHQQDSIPGGISSTQNVDGNANGTSAQRILRLAPISNPLELGPFTEAENGSHQSPTIATLRRNNQSGWYRAASSGIGSSSSAISGERAATHGEQNSGSIPTDTSQHPMFMPASEISNSYQTTTNWGLVVEDVGVSMVASSSGFGLSTGVNSPAPSLAPLQNSTDYPRRPSEFGRRSLIPPSGAETGNQDNNYSSLHSAPASSSSDLALPSGSSNPGHHRLHSRTAALLLERHLGSTNSSRSLAASGEGRSRLVSEIRNVLDRMRRGEGLRVEDVMILDQSVLFGMADFHDRHRDMRLDVDNMSYEELLALGERIGNVSTGLSEETISNRLKQRKHKCVDTEGDAKAAEPCCVCQEEYKDGEDLGILLCGHDFHTECINQWLMQKNSCPICKKTGLSK